MAHTGRKSFASFAYVPWLFGHQPPLCPMLTTFLLRYFLLYDRLLKLRVIGSIIRFIVRFYPIALFAVFYRIETESHISCTLKIYDWISNGVTWLVAKPPDFVV